jgi:hypothetical protein
MKTPPISDQIESAHRLYCQLTGQTIPMRYDRQRLWYELLQAGFTLADLRTVITYLQKQIRQGKRNVGALKISNLTQPDRFEEDLAISRIRLRPAPQPARQTESARPRMNPAQRERERQRALQLIQNLKKSIDSK